MRIFIFLALILTVMSLPAEKLKVFILAGQSNMQGHAKTPTLEYLADDPKTAALYKEIKKGDGYAEAKNVYISYLTGTRSGNGHISGKLGTGYGALRGFEGPGEKIGPEYTLGLTLVKELSGPVLIIKTAWGGKSLYHDFRPPSAGVYPQTEEDKEKKRFTPDKSGHYYKLMKDHVNKVLKDIKSVYPAYDGSGYEIAGFVWFQGWNDMVNRSVYPTTDNDDRFKEYGNLLTHFIRDVRKDFNTPKMPFVIGVMGVGGMKNEKSEPFRIGMRYPSTLEEFKGSVATVETGEFWDEALGAIDKKRGEVKQMSFFLRVKHKKHANKDGSMSKEEQKEYLKKFEAKLISPEEKAKWEKGASNAGYHYLGCGKTFALMGKAYAKKLIEFNGKK